MRLHGLYVITDTTLTPDAQLVDAVAQALAGGATWVQYRAKHTPASERRAQAGALRDLCRAAAAGFIINDDLDLAVALAADGVHLGRADTGIAAARARLGPHAIIGASCYAELELAHAAAAAGASYLAFGSMFPSPTKPTAVRAPLALLRTARAQLHLPIAAIGGITQHNAAQVVAAGADLIAVISGVFATPNIYQAAHALSMLCSPEQPQPLGKIL